ncbi:MAG: biopolymer transporter ExbD [Phycisphaerales bacterium]
MRFAATRSTRRSPLGALPMTPMIDVVFLLLIYFLVTSDFSLEESRLSAASAVEKRGPAATELTPQIVDVKLVDGRDTFVVGELATHDARELTALLRRLPKTEGVAIRVADNVSVASAAAALQSAADAGFTRRSYVPAAE